MKKKFFNILLVFCCAIFCLASLTGCFGNKGDGYQTRIQNVEADSVTNYWIEYQMDYSNHELQTIAKATKDGTTYYYLRFTNKPNSNEMFVKLNANGSYEAYSWDYLNKIWVKRTDIDSNPAGYGEGTDWFEFKTSFLSDYFSMALVNLQYTGDVNSRWRYENGTEVKDMGSSSWTTAGYDCGYNEHISHVVEAEEIENCHYFYDEKEGGHYYFAPETNFLLNYSGDGSTYNRTTKVYKRVFDMNHVLEVHDVTTAGLGEITLPNIAG